MTSASIVGTWALVATEWRRADGRHANPFGAGATGILIYTEEGYMSAQVMRADRPPAPVASATGIDMAMAGGVAGYIAYFGTYSVDVGHGAVTHYVIGASFPAWSGGEVRRGFRVESGRLTLTDRVIGADGVAVDASTT